MKNKKWLNYTLGILLTLIVLTAVAGAGVRAGMMQNVPFARHMRDTRLPMMQSDERFTQENPSPQGNSQDNANPQAPQGNLQDNANPQTPQGNPNSKGVWNGFQSSDFQRRMFDNDLGFNRRDGRFSFLPPIFGLVRLAVLGLLVWLGYKVIKNSGWRLSLARETATPVAEAPVKAKEEEQKETE